MSDPLQPGPLAAVLEALGATTQELKATKDEVTKLKGEAEYLRKYGHKNRLRIGVVAAGLVLDIAASAVAGYALASLHSEQVKVESGQVQAQRNAATISQLRDNNLDACQAGNGRLVKQQQALDAILSQVPPRDAAERAIVAKDEAFIQAGWSPRDCARIYPLPPGH